MDAVRKDCSRVRNWARLFRARQENSSHLSSQTRSFSLSTLLPCLSSSRLITSFIDFHRLPSASSIRMHPSSTKSDFSFLHAAPYQKSMSSMIGQPNQLFCHGLRAYTLFHIACKPQHANMLNQVLCFSTKMKACRAHGEACYHWSASSYRFVGSG